MAPAGRRPCRARPRRFELPRMTHPTRLILFGKVPRAGRVKTRLVPFLTHEQAAALYGAFLYDIAARNRPAVGELELHVAPPLDPAALAAHLPVGLTVREQRGRDLSARMSNAFEDAFRERPDALVVLRNTDSPLLPPAREAEAFAALQAGAEIVFGPDRGGGYYLVGLRRPAPELFSGQETSIPSNFANTLRKARALADRIRVLATETDVDEPSDVMELIDQLECDESARHLAPRTALMLDTLGPARLRRSGSTA